MEKVCPFCSATFEADHGNKKYCSDECYDAHKRKMQRETNSMIKKFKQGYLSNDEVFQEMLPEPGRIRIPIHKLLKTGFDQDAFYGTYKNEEGIVWHFVGDYGFGTSEINGEKFLHLFKNK